LREIPESKETREDEILLRVNDEVVLLWVILNSLYILLQHVRSIADQKKTCIVARDVSVLGWLVKICVCTMALLCRQVLDI